MLSASPGNAAVRRLRPALAALTLLLAGALAVTCALAYARFRAGQPALRDFLSFYAGARLFAVAPAFRWERAPARLYSDTDQYQSEQALEPRAPYMPYLRPALFAALLSPLSRLPFPHALVIWLALNAAAALALGVWCARRMKEPAMLLLLGLFVPLIVALNVGQDTPLLVLALVGCLYLFESERPLAAGLLLCGLWVKPQWLPPFVLLLAARKQWRALAAFAAGSAAVWTIFPPLHYLRFLKSMQGYPGVPACLACMPNVRGLLAPWTAVHGRVEALSAVAMGAVWIAMFARARRLSQAAAFALACAAAVVAGYYSHIYDCLLLVPAIAVSAAFATARWQKIILGLALSPLPYLAQYWSSHLRGVPALMALAVFVTIAQISPPSHQDTKKAIG